MDRIDQIWERQERDVDFVRGAGGHVSTDDMRAMHEELVWASVSLSAETDDLHLAEMKLNDAEEWLVWFFSARNSDPEMRAVVRPTVKKVRDYRSEVARLTSERRDDHARF